MLKNFELWGGLKKNSKFPDLNLRNMINIIIYINYKVHKYIMANVDVCVCGWWGGFRLLTTHPFLSTLLELII